MSQEIELRSPHQNEQNENMVEKPLLAPRVVSTVVPVHPRDNTVLMSTQEPKIQASCLYKSLTTFLVAILTGSLAFYDPISRGLNTLIYNSNVPQAYIATPKPEVLTTPDIWTLPDILDTSDTWTPAFKTGLRQDLEKDQISFG